MSWSFNFLVRILLAALLFAAGGVIAGRWWDRCGLKTAIAYYVVRIAAMVAAVEALGMVPFDVSGWHLHAGWMLDGLFPGRDFLTPYHLGFNGLLALCESAWRSPSSIIVFFTLCEALALRLLYKVADKLLGRKVAKRGMILYLSSPICLMQSTFSAQDETLFTLAIAACLYFTFVADSPTGRSATSILAVFCTKLIAPFYMVPFLLLRRWKAVAVFGLAFAAYMWANILFGVPKLGGFLFGREPGLAAPADDILRLVTSGNLAALFPMVPGNTWNWALLCLLSVTGLVALRSLPAKTDDRARLSLATHLMTVWLLLFMLLFRMTYSYYLIPVFPLMCLMAQDEAYLPRRMRPVSVAWTFLFAFKDMLQTGCDLYGFLPGRPWVPTVFSALCVMATGLLLVVHTAKMLGGTGK